MRLVCFPYAGGSAEDFVDWGDSLPPGIELWAATYSGTQNERHNLIATALQVAGALLSARRLPLAMFGHSVGALVAQTVACELERAGAAPDLVVLSAPSDPTRQQGLRPELLRDRDFLLQLARGLGMSVESLEAETDASRRFLETFAAHVSWIQEFDKSSKLSAPVVLSWGSADPINLDFWRMRGAVIDEWQFEGGHLYLHRESRRLVQHVADRASRWLVGADDTVRPRTSGER
jgi:surfactin synthase thioesterase subunit